MRGGHPLLFPHNSLDRQPGGSPARWIASPVECQPSRFAGSTGVPVQKGRPNRGAGARLAKVAPVPANYEKTTADCRPAECRPAECRPT